MEAIKNEGKIMEKTITIGVPCTPAIKTKLESLGKRKRICVNSNGGMGGGKVICVGNTGCIDDNILQIGMTESNRTVNATKSWISTTEDVELFKQTHIHKNNGFKSPMVNYYIVKGGLKLKQGEAYDNDSHRENPFISKIDVQDC